MVPLDHWHPVLEDGRLRTTPLAVRVCGEEIVLFRTASGRAGALQHECPHRRMPLSEGCVRGEHLVCAYHGWQFGPGGEARCPAMPGAQMSIATFDVAVQQGVIWVKNAASNARLPSLDAPGHVPLCRLRMLVRAPLELVADNLAEMEHTGEAHLYFGYDTDRLHEVELTTEAGADFVRVIAVGPQRRLPALMNAARRLTGAASDDLFVDDLVVRFSPVHVVSDSYWVARRTGERRPDALHSRVFLVPRTSAETELFGFFYLPAGRSRIAGLLRPFLTRVLRLELERDRRVTEKVAGRDASVDGMHLSRFDQPLIEIRKRIARHYGALDTVNARGEAMSSIHRGAHRA